MLASSAAATNVTNSSNCRLTGTDSPLTSDCIFSSANTGENYGFTELALKVVTMYRSKII